ERRDQPADEWMQGAGEHRESATDCGRPERQNQGDDRSDRPRMRPGSIKLPDEPSEQHNRMDASRELLENEIERDCGSERRHRYRPHRPSGEHGRSACDGRTRGSGATPDILVWSKDGSAPGKYVSAGSCGAVRCGDGGTPEDRTTLRFGGC